MGVVGDFVVGAVFNLVTMVIEEGLEGLIEVVDVIIIIELHHDYSYQSSLRQH